MAETVKIESLKFDDAIINGQKKRVVSICVTDFSSPIVVYKDNLLSLWNCPSEIVGKEAVINYEDDCIFCPTHCPTSIVVDGKTVLTILLCVIRD